MAQLVKHPTLAQVMISQFVGSSPTLGSVLTAQGLEPVSDSVFPSLSAPPALTLCLSLSNKYFKIHVFKKKRSNQNPADAGKALCLPSNCLNLHWKGEERESVSRGGAEREGNTESKAGSRL